MRRWIDLLLVIGLAGCGDNQLGINQQRPNLPPETTLSSGPPDSTLQTVYKVQLFWSGTDRDGTIDHYDFILVDHPPVQDHIAGGPGDDPTRVVVTVPEPDDPRWVGTSATDSTFITLADTLRRDAQPDSAAGENGDVVRRVPFERWHTFFVRAVDNEGMPDPTPDYRSFNSHNIAPQVHLLPPVKAGNVFPGPIVIVFNWEGEDEVGDGTFKNPVASRWTWIASWVTANGTPDNVGYLSFPDSLYNLPSRYKWSNWNRWDALDGSGKSQAVRFPGHVGDTATPGSPDPGYYIFAAQALDEGGAVTPVFDWKTPGKNNVALVRVGAAGYIGPRLDVEDTFLGKLTFVGGSRPVQIDIAAGQPLNFHWSGDASSYGGSIVAYRYGWDLRDPNNDQEWSSWCSTCTRAPTRSFASGTHRFFVQVRDNAESITTAVIELSVHPVTRTRDLLWVDDTDFTTGAEPIEDARWLKVLGDVAAAHGIQFDPGLDVFDVQDNHALPPPIGKLFDYKAVIWTNVSGPARTSALRALCVFVDPFATANTSQSFNYVNLYLANKGCLWISGFRPARQVWPDVPGQDAVNVTQWDPPPPNEHPPGVDSVGTISLLYKMGVEMFDVGAGTDSPRSAIDHFCQGFERAMPPGFEQQTTESSVAVGHTHHVTISSRDIDVPVPSPDGVTYETDVVQEHKHTVHLTPEELLQLRQGMTVTVESSVSATPEPHRHTFELVDQLGLWGAPALLTTSAWLQPTTQPRGLHGRPNIEIYNMPNAVASQSPPLNPNSVPVYTYVSGPSVQQTSSPPFSYPQTADKQPAFILARGSALDRNYTRAFCGFEVYLLQEESHRRLTEFVLVRHFGLGQMAN